MFLQYVDPEGHPQPKAEPTEEEIIEKEKKASLFNKLIEKSNAEFYKKASENVKNAIKLRKQRDK